jgi:phosphatidylserine decarboxylase
VLYNPSHVSQTRGIGTIRSYQTGPEYEDDGLSSDEADDQEGEASDDEDETEPKSSTTDDSNAFAETSRSSSPDLTPTPSPTTVTLPPTHPARHYLPSIPKILTWRSPRSTSSPSSSAASTPSLPSTRQSSFASETSGKAKAGRRKKLPGPWHGQKGGAYELEADNDIVGIVMLEIHGATDLPRLRNSELCKPSLVASMLIDLQVTRTGWDMDPFVVVSFGKRVFRTRVIRHSLNPVWDEKLLFHVRKYEKSFRVQLTVLDWDKLSANDHVGDAAIDVTELAENVPKKDPNTGLYPEEEDGTRTFQEYKLPLATAKEMPWEAKYNPILTFR